MAKSKKTRNNQICYVILSVLSVMLWIGPIGIFGYLAIIQGTFLYQKISLSVTFLIVVIMTIINVTTRLAMRSRLWIMLIGLYICLHNIMLPIIVFAVCQTVDELIVSPLKVYFKTKYKINKEIDGRINA
jgi:hypothetical protein